MANENLPPATMAGLLKELRALAKEAPDGVSVSAQEDCIATIHFEIRGPVETPYFSGVFRGKLLLGNDYPTQPPKALFVTKIFHPNVSADGMICVNSLKKDWQPTQGIRHTLSVIRCLLIVPNPESALNEEAAKLLLENYDDYASRARLFTNIYALEKVEPDATTNESLEASAGDQAMVKPLQVHQSRKKRSIKRL